MLVQLLIKGQVLQEVGRGQRWTPSLHSSTPPCSDHFPPNHHPTVTISLPPFLPLLALIVSLFFYPSCVLKCPPHPPVSPCVTRSPAQLPTHTAYPVLVSTCRVPISQSVEIQSFPLYHPSSFLCLCYLSLCHCVITIKIHITPNYSKHRQTNEQTSERENE